MDDVLMPDEEAAAPAKASLSALMPLETLGELPHRVVEEDAARLPHDAVLTATANAREEAAVVVDVLIPAI